jgi:uncharacterized protein YxjI
VQKDNGARQLPEGPEGHAEMRYLVTRYPLSSKNDGVILDEDGRRIFRVTNTTRIEQVGAPLARGIVIADEHAHELAAVWEGHVGQGRAKIYDEDTVVAWVQRVVPPPPPQRFHVQFANGETLVAQGDFANHHYTIRRGARNVAQVSEGQTDGSDLYEVSVGPGMDSELILACAAVIDMLANTTGDLSAGNLPS